MEKLQVGETSVRNLGVITLMPVAVIPREGSFLVVRFVAMAMLSASQVIMDFVAGHVPPYKKVREVELVEQIPKLPSWKIFRRVLVAKERAVLTSLLWEEVGRAVLPR